GTAVHDRVVPTGDARVGEHLADALRGQEAAAVVQEGGGGQVDGPRDVAGPGVDRLGQALVPLGGAGVDQHAAIRPVRHRGDVDGLHVAAPAREVAALHRVTRPYRQVLPFGDPGLEPAVEEGDVLLARPAQQPPGAGRGGAAGVVVDLHAVVVVDARPARRLLDLVGRRQRVPALLGRRGRRQVGGEVDELRTGDVTGEVVLPAERVTEPPPHVEDRGRRQAGDIRDEVAGRDEQGVVGASGGG